MDKEREALLKAAREKIAKLRPKRRKLGLVGENGEITPIIVSKPPYVTPQRKP